MYNNIESEIGKIGVIENQIWIDPKDHHYIIIYCPYKHITSY